MSIPNLEIESLLNQKYLQFNNLDFIENDPIVIPHGFSKKQDIEISGLFASVLAWGQRKTIISKCRDLLNRMDNDPHEFVLNHQESDLKAFLGFKHRTFNEIDTLYFISFLKEHYNKNSSLEELFSSALHAEDLNVKNGIVNFNKKFFEDEFSPKRTQKHISTPLKNSACKRINMYLRWMVRKDNSGVDFGIWDSIKTSQLICPCDVHVERIARILGLIKSQKLNWNTAEELTNNLKTFDDLDPVKFDFALFGLGIEGYFD